MISRGAVARSLAVLAILTGQGLVAITAQAGVWPTEVDKLTRQLEASDVGERRAAASRLVSLPSHLAASLVLQALEDGDVGVRLDAAQAAIAHRTPGAEERVLGWLNEPDARVRLAACQVLRATPTAAAVAPLGRVLSDPDTRVRQIAAAALGNTGVSEAVVALLGHLDDWAPEVRVAVVEALWRLGDARAVVPLVGKAQDSVPEVRRAVAKALGQLQDKRATPVLMLALRDSVNEVRVDVLGALGRIGDPASVMAIVPLTEAQTPTEVRRAALSALGQIGGPLAVSTLIGALERDTALPGGAPARDALVKMGPAAVPALITALGAAPSDNVASFAAEALGMLRAPQAREPITRALRQGVLPARHALKALAALGDSDALPAVLELLSDRSEAIRAEARRTAGVLLDSRGAYGFAVDPIAAVLDDVRLPVDERASLARLLGRTHAPRAAKLLAPLVSAQSVTIELAAIDALGALGPAGEDAALLSALDDDDAVVRAHAAAALAASAQASSVERVLARIGSAQQQDRAALATVIAGALARSSSDKLAEQAEALLPASEGAMRDALLEGLGRMSSERAGKVIERMAASVDMGDRRKAAEMLAGHAGAKPTLKGLLSDFDAGVRANAVWSFWTVGDAADIAALSPLLSDGNVAVAANVAVVIGRVSARAGDVEGAKPALCPALSDGRSYVRAAALMGLRAAGARCGSDGASERALLAQDPSAVVRSAAADLLQQVPLGGGDERALARCRLEDVRGSVATRCSAAPTHVEGDEPASVLVVPDGQQRPAMEAPFALVLADRSVRHGVTDRRGAIFERMAPRGSVSLDVPAPFVR